MGVGGILYSPWISFPTLPYLDPIGVKKTRWSSHINVSPVDVRLNFKKENKKKVQQN